VAHDAAACGVEYGLPAARAPPREIVRCGWRAE